MRCGLAQMGRTEPSAWSWPYRPTLTVDLLRLRSSSIRSAGPKEEVTALIEAVLVEAGMDGWEIRTDGPGIVGPGDRIEEIERHVENGCWIYSTTGWTAEGTRLFWIAGK